jgi:hypothetical protein
MNTLTTNGLSMYKRWYLVYLKNTTANFYVFHLFCTIVSNLEINLKAKWERKTLSSYVYEQSGPQIESIHITVQSELIKRYSPQWNRYYCHEINSSTQSPSLKAGVTFNKVSVMLHQGIMLPYASQSCYILYTVFGEPQGKSLKLCDWIWQMPQLQRVRNHTAVADAVYTKHHQYWLLHDWAANISNYNK